LFGSKARGDDRRNSDTDLLGVSDGGPIRLENSVRGVSQYRYPYGYLRKKSEEGDLFLAHIVFEGKVLHDTANSFQRIKEYFRFKATYSKEVLEAHAIIAFMTQNSRLIKTRLQRSRLIWAIRTLVAARQAEKGYISFSSKALEDFTGIEGLKNCIDTRYRIDPSEIAKLALVAAEALGDDQLHTNFPSDHDDRVQFLSDLGGIAADTAFIFVPPQRRKKLKGGISTTLGYSFFEPE
jgi:predicted nucleotidyltransferase